MRLLKTKRNIFFSICISTVLVLFTLVFIINRSLSYNDLLNAQREHTLSHAYIDNITTNDITSINKQFDIIYLGQASYYDGNKNKADKYFTLIDINEELLKIQKNELLIGRFPNKENEVILEKWAKDNMKKYIKGDYLYLDLHKRGPQKFKIVGILKDYPSNKDQSKIEIYKKIPKNKAYRDIFICFGNKSNKNDSIEKLSQYCKNKNLKMSVNKPLLEKENEYNNIFSTNMLLMNVIFFLIMYFSIKGIYYISIRERMKEFGVLRAIGVENKTLFNIIIGDILYYSLLPAFTGMLLGTLLSFLLKNTIKNLYELESFQIIVDYHIFLVIIPVLLSWIALSLENYKRIMKSNIINLLNFEHEDTEKGSFNMIKFPIKNVITKIPLNNLLKNKYKTLFMTLSLGIISSLLIAGVFYSNMKNIAINQAIKYENKDYILSINAFYVANEISGLDENELGQIKNIRINNKSAIKDADGFKVLQGRIIIKDKDKIRDFSFFKDLNTLGGEYTKKVLKWVFREDNGQYEVKSNLIGINDTYLKKIRKSLKISDSDLEKFKKGQGAVLFNAPNSKGDRVFNYKNKDIISFKHNVKYYENLGSSDDKESFKNLDIQILGQVDILGVYTQDYVPDFVPCLLVSNTYLDKHTGLDKYKIVKINPKDGFSVEKISDKISSIIENKPNVNLSNFEEEIFTSKQFSDSQQKILVTINLLLLLIMFLNISNSMIYKVLNRKDEYNVLMKIGANKKQIRYIILLEGLILGIIAAILSLLISTGLEIALYRYFLNILYEPVFYNNIKIILLVLVLNITIGVISSAIPLSYLRKDNK
ncbi:hypothetical protein HMPREF1639_05855 [Peptostreptococcus sp. MV1]|uniref:FtsX-like permease family protein n=1 Tax=Peptostreptococcus sp. MV1 TaxID=1219626 RepID=UPI00050ED72A|nr:ABC transporter permease [Peptostreptococcus sp. MV1]KGF12667.1 hypothetical protein HMPREF1639_05855 [Peptostreptococcus sp. MV1]